MANLKTVQKLRPPVDTGRVRKDELEREGWASSLLLLNLQILESHLTC